MSETENITVQPFVLVLSGCNDDCPDRKTFHLHLQRGSLGQMKNEPLNFHPPGKYEWVAAAIEERPAKDVVHPRVPNTGNKVPLSLKAHI
jgi:hypothetical protein